MRASFDAILRAYRASDQTVSDRSESTYRDYALNASFAGYSMTLFQSLATAAGYDPLRGPGSSCSDEGSSGQCVLPWGGGHKAVSSVVLVSNGVSFAVRSRSAITSIRSHMRSYWAGHDSDLHDHWLCRRLWDVRTMAPAHPHRHMLGCAVCEHVTHLCVQPSPRCKARAQRDSI